MLYYCNYRCYTPTIAITDVITSLFSGATRKRLLQTYFVNKTYISTYQHSTFVLFTFIIHVQFCELEKV